VPAGSEGGEGRGPAQTTQRASRLHASSGVGPVGFEPHNLRVEKLVEGRFRSCPLTTGDRCNETSELDLGTDLDYPFRGEPEEANRAGGIAVHQGEETVNQ